MLNSLKKVIMYIFLKKGLILFPSNLEKENKESQSSFNLTLMVIINALDDLINSMRITAEA